MRNGRVVTRRSSRRKFALAGLPVAALGLALAQPTIAEARPAEAPPAAGRRHKAATPSKPAKGPKVRWDRFEAVALGGGWRLVDLEGDAPVYGLELDGQVEGLVSFIAFPLESLPGVAEALAAKGPKAALRVHADNFLASFRDDRTQGCGADYGFTPEPTRLLHAPGGHLISYGFTGGAAGSSPTERTLQWAMIEDGHLLLANVAAYDEGGCLPPEGLDLDTKQSAAVDDALAALFDRNGFPAPDQIVGGGF